MLALAAGSAMRGLTRTAQVALNAVTNYFRFAFTLILFLLLTPFIIRKVGVNDYGLWTLMYSVVGFFGLFDLGFSTSVVKYVAECKGSGDLDRRNRIVNTLLIAYLILSVAATVGVGLLSLFFNRVFAIPPPQHHKALVLLWILAVRAVMLSLPLDLFRGVIFGEQRIYLVNIVQIGGSVFYGLTAWIALGHGMGLLALAWIHLATMLLENFLYISFAFHYVEGLRISWSLADRKVFKEVASFSAGQFIINVSAVGFLHMGPILIKLLLPLSAVAIYAVALKISENLRILVIQFINVFTPYIAELKGAGDDEKIRYVFVECTKFSCAMMVLLTVPVWSYAREAVTFWAGPELAEAAPVLIVLAGYRVISIPWTMASNVLGMTGYHKYTARLSAVCLLTNIFISVALIHPLKLMGVALGALISTMIVGAFIVVKKACHVYHLSYWDYVSRAVIPVALPGALQFAVTYGIKTWMPPTNLAAIALQGLPGVVLFGVIFWLFSVTSSEKRLLSEKLGLTVQVVHHRVRRHCSI